MERIDGLVEGFIRFQKQYFDRFPSCYRELNQGQKPSTLIIGCGDSRVDPAILLDSDPGDVFTVRNVASLVPPPSQDVGHQSVLAAIQYAVVHLHVAHIIVLGHSQCGGIRALMEQGGCSHQYAQEHHLGYVYNWMSIAAPAREKVLQELAHASLDEQSCACEKESVLLSLHNLALMQEVKERVDAGDLLLHGWYFDMVEGSMFSYSEQEAAFVSVVPPSLMSERAA